MTRTSRARERYVGGAARVVALAVALAGLGLGLGLAVAPASSAAEEATPAPGLFASVQPTRLLDTRSGLGMPDGAPAAVPSGGSVTVRVAGGDSPVGAGAAAAVLTVTATRGTTAGHITAYPTGDAVPTASSLNFAAGQTVANAVTVKLSPDGFVTLTSGAPGVVHLLVDVSGWYAGGSSDVPGAFTALTPSRLLDTREGVGAPAAMVPAGGRVTFQVTDRAGVPLGAGAVVLNVTVTRPLAAGHVTAYPAGGTLPTASNLNFVRGQTVANAVTVKLGDGGWVTLANGAAGEVHLLADVAGWFSATSAEQPATAPGAFTSTAPVRLLDTRDGTGTGAAATVPANGAVTFKVAGRAGVPTTAGAAVLNVTVTRTRGAGHVTAHPTGSAVPTASNLNFAAGQTVPGQVTVQLGVDGRVTLRNGAAAPIDLVADLGGWYAAPPAEAVAVTRVSVTSAGDERARTSGAVHDVSSDGRYVLFESDAADLDPGTPLIETSESLLYVRDTLEGTTDLVTVSSAGRAPDGPSQQGSLSDDGRYVAFSSLAGNLVSGDTNGKFDVFVRDRQAATTSRVVGNGGAQLDAHAYAPDVSADGSRVAFASGATDVVPGNVEPAVAQDVYVWDRATRRSVVVPDHPAQEGFEGEPSLSADGTRVAFTSSAPLTPDDSGDGIDVFVHDLATAATTRLSGQVQGGARAPRLSDDGTRVAWSTTAGGAFARDAAAATATVDLREGIPVTPARVTGRVSLSSDGARAGFAVSVEGVSLGYVRDLGTGAFTEVTGQDADATTVVVSGTGARVAFASTSSTLVPDDENGTADVFVRDLG